MWIIFLLFAALIIWSWIAGWRWVLLIFATIIIIGLIIGFIEKKFPKSRVGRVIVKLFGWIKAVVEQIIAYV